MMMNSSHEHQRRTRDSKYKGGFDNRKPLDEYCFDVSYNITASRFLFLLIQS